MAARIVTWDWKEQPPMRDIARAVSELSGGQVHMREVDDYPVDDAEAERLDEASRVSLGDLESP